MTGPQRDAAAPRSDDSEREKKRRPVPVTEFANWQPPAEEGDDEPLLGPRGREERGREEGASPQSARSAAHTASASAGSSGAQQREGQLYNAPVAESGEPEGDPADHAELFVTVGRRDGIRAQDLLRVLVEVAGLDKHTIRRIRVRDRHAFISVRKADAATAIAKLHGTALAGRTLTVEVARERSGEMQEGSPES